MLILPFVVSYRHMSEDQPKQTESDEPKDNFAIIEEWQQENNARKAQEALDMQRAAQASRDSVIGDITAPVESGKGFVTRVNEFQDAHPKAANMIKLGAVAGVLAGGSTILVNELTQPNPTQQAEIAQQKMTDAAAKQYNDSVEKAINATYDQKAVVGPTIEIQQGDSHLFDSSQQIVIDAIGQDAFNADPGHVSGPLLDSSKAFSNNQSGEKFDVVKTDLDPAKHNGDEYITVPASQIIAPAGTDIPTPNTH
jgi:hypothetical protein